ncbi:alpha/beta hydrolase [Archangium violaceum]|uniref:alpha/beta fold hydrolase n=1 Tax=Archangium violaceum TaxID=83451 RepID=UPI001950F6A2|nr:alpha/beta hydrolase [Archangium violaceum]QRN97964.1 alpha/beta hydrolase [Archangium violaceum]
MSRLESPGGGVERGTVRSGSFELHYSMEGSGRPAIVIGSALYYPRTFSDELRRSLRLVFVDHRGFAHSSKEEPASEYALDLLLADVERVREHLGLDEVIIIGHSGHGYMALEYAKKYPRHVSHVVMICTGPSHGAAHNQLKEQYWEEAVCPERKAKQERDLKLLPGEIAAAPERRFITYCLRMGARSWYDPEFDATELWKGVHVNMTMFDHVFGEVFRDIDITKGLDALDLPVFLAMGRFDYLVAPYSAWAPYREHFRDLTVRVFDRSGHTPQLEESRLFDAELLHWLDSRTPGG